MKSIRKSKKEEEIEEKKKRKKFLVPVFFCWKQFCLSVSSVDRNSGKSAKKGK